MHCCSYLGQGVLLLVAARKQATSEEILLWMTPSEAPKALQASACNELLGPTGANCWIFAQHQPGKFTRISYIEIVAAHLIKLCVACQPCVTR